MRCSETLFSLGPVLGPLQEAQKPGTESEVLAPTKQPKALPTDPPSQCGEKGRCSN